MAEREVNIVHLLLFITNNDGKDEKYVLHRTFKYILNCGIHMKIDIMADMLCNTGTNCGPSNINIASSPIL